MSFTDPHWWPFLYQYGVGLVIFLTGIAIILGYKSCNFTRQRDRFWFGVLIFGFVWYMGIHFLWYMAAYHILPAAQAGGAG